MKFRKEIDDTGRSFIRIDLEGLELPKFNFDINGLLDFSVDTYEVLKASKDMEKWGDVFKIPEQFLATLTDDELRQIAAVYIYAHWLILTRMAEQRPIPDDNAVMASQIRMLNAEIFRKLENELSELIANLDSAIDLYPKLLDYTIREVPVQQSEHVGERPQDSSDMTFYRNDVIELTALAILSKLFAPVIGIFIKQFMQLGIDNLYKEIHAVTMFKQIVANRCQHLADKFDYFVSRIIKPLLKDPRPTNLYNGFTQDVIRQYIYATVLTRKFVTVNLFREQTNLIIYLTTCAKETANSQFGGGKNRPSIELRRDIEEFSSTISEDGNGSVLEQESSTSDKTADFETIIEFVVEDIRKNFADEYDLNSEIIAAAEAYYTSSNHLQLSNCNSFLLSTMFGNRLCGAKTIEMLKLTDLAVLIPILQMYFIKHGFYDLVHLVSLVNTGAFKTQLSGEETRLSAAWRNNYAYVNCDSRYPFEVNGITWSTGLQKIVEDVTTMKFAFNTAPVIWEAMKQENVNGTIYNPPFSLSESICNFILQMDTSEVQG